MDKVQKIREEVERLKIQNETYVDKEYTESEKWSKHGAYHILFKLLDFIDSLPEEPVSDDFTKALAECISQAQVRVVDPLVLAETWKDELIKLAKSEEPVSEDNNLRKASEEYLKVLSETPYNNTPITNAQTIVRELITFMDNPSKYNPNHIEETVSEDLGDYINELSKQFPEVSFAKLSRIAVRVAQWQKQQIKKAMYLGESPYLISVEQAYYRTLELLEE